MNSSGINAIMAQSSLAQSSLADQQMQSLKRQAGTSTAEGMTPAKEKKLRQACEGFEAVFIQKMWESMRASLPKEGPMHSREEQFWQGLYDQELGKSMAASGGIGLADMMMTQLSRKLGNASEMAAMRNRRVPFSIAPVSILPDSMQKTQQQAKSAKPAQPASSLYEGEAKQPEAESAPNDDPVAAVKEELARQAESPVEGALRDLTAENTPKPTKTDAPVTYTYPQGTQPTQTLDQLAATLAAKAALANRTETVHVTKTRQLNSPDQPPRIIRRQAASAYAKQAAENPQNVVQPPLANPPASPTPLKISSLKQ